MTSKSRLQLNLQIGKGIGRVYITHVSDKPTPGTWVLENIHEGAKVKVKVIGSKLIKGDRR